MNGKSVDEGLMEMPVSGHDVAVLLGELQTAQLELETQNDELFVSSELLKTERAKFEQLFNFAPVGYFILDKMGVIEELNQAAEELLAVQKEEVLDKRFQYFVASEDWERFYSFLHNLEISNAKQHIDIKLLFGSGTTCYTRVEGLKTKSKYNDQVQYYITVTDVTEIRLAQQNLQATAQRLEMTLMASGTGTWTLDIENRNIYMDGFCCSLFEINPAEFDGTFKGFIQLVDSEDRERVWQNLSHSINNIQPIDLEFRFLTRTAEQKIFSLKGREVKNDSYSKFYVGVLVDITQQVSIADDARKLHYEKQRLILSTTLNAQEKERQKISSVLHDSVCQLLYGVKLNIQSLQKSTNLTDEFKNVNALLDQAISETRALSYDLTPSVLRDFGFTAGVREIAQRFSTPTFKINTIVKKETDLLESNLQLVVFRIMQEVLNNCIKHSNASLTEIKVCTEENMVTLIVSDNGKGFEESLSTALAKGSGLRGIKHRIFLLDGSMDIESSKSGTSVTIRLRKDLALSDF